MSSLDKYEFLFSLKVSLLISLLYLLPLLGIWSSGLDWEWQTLLSVLCCYWGYRQLIIQGLRSHPSSIKRIQKTESGWMLFFKSGHCLEATLHRDSFISPYLTVLNFIPLTVGWRRWFEGKSIVLLPGAMPNDQYRKLRVYLRTNSLSPPEL